MVRVLVTGSRYLFNLEVRELVTTSLVALLDHVDSKKNLVIVHGDCLTGIDRLYREEAEKLGIATEGHPADWQKHGKAAGPKRNQEMVDLGADVCLAWPHPTKKSSGTKDCVRRARAAGIPVYQFDVPISTV